MSSIFSRQILNLFRPARLAHSSAGDMALSGVKVVEMAGLAPAPFCGMILADFGAQVTRVDRSQEYGKGDKLCRGKRSLAVDLKKPSGREVVRRLCRNADVLIEPYRPGVMEKLGLGPAELMKENPGLIYARLTGYGQEGPLKDRAGHDINYLAISGILSRLGEKASPSPPINMLADFAGGGLICALGVVLALFHRNKSGQGQVIDANMVEGAAYVASFAYYMLNSPVLTDTRGDGLLDGGAPFYGVYRTKDGKFMAVGALEPQFYAKLINGLGLTQDDAPQFGDWAELRRLMTLTFQSRTQQEWCTVFDEVDACVTPVLTVPEALKYPHNTSKNMFSGGPQPVPRSAPRLSKSPGLAWDKDGAAAGRMVAPGENSLEILKELKYSEEEIRKFISEGVVERNGGGGSSKL